MSEVSVQSMLIIFGLICIVVSPFLYLANEQAKEKEEDAFNDSEDIEQNNSSFFELGKFYYEQQRFAEAAIQLETFLEIKKISLNAFIMLAYCYEYEGDLEKSLKNYEAALEINPKNSKILPHYVQLLIEVGDEAKAENVCEQTVKLEAANAEMFHTYACMLQKKGEHKKACQMFEQASKSYDDEHIENIDVYVDWAESLLELNQQINASSMIFKALEQDPRYKRALEVSKRISI